ncbi:carbohydrate-binding protein, partial [Spartinivicinus marinus]
MSTVTLRQPTHWISVTLRFLYIILVAFFILTTLAKANPISLNKPAWASSVENYQLDARFAVDGNLDTRWSSQFSDGQWITIDLGKSLPIKRVQLFWEEAYASQYTLQVSDDHWQWRNLYQQRQGKGGEEDIVVNGKGRYFRLRADKRATTWGISLKEIKVYASDSPVTAHQLPGKIQAEQFSQFYDTTPDNLGGELNPTSVDIEKTTDEGSGYNVGWIEPGEWLNYSVKVEKTGKYQVKFRVASAVGGGQFHLELNGHDITGLLSFNETGGWQQWQTITSKPVQLSQGNHQLKLVMDDREFNINWFEVVATTDPVPPNPIPGKTPVAKHGQLRVEAGQLVNQQGKPVQLKGMSSHGLQWFGQFMNKSSIKWLRDDWQATVVRAAMYTAPSSNGYIKNKQLKQKVLEVVDVAARNPLSFNNIMYTLHFYAGSHKASLRQRAQQAMAQGAAIFVTEWGVSDASGNGGVFLPESKRWLEFLDKHKISWLNW